MSDQIMQALGRIEGKLDSEISLAKEHRADDARRFTDVYGRLDDHEKDINQAKGAKGALMWAAGAVAGIVGVAASFLGKYLSGGH